WGCSPPYRADASLLRGARPQGSTLFPYTTLFRSLRDGFGEMPRLLGVRGERTAVRHVAERAAARADVAEDHEGRGALAEALGDRSEEHTSELQSRSDLVCRLLLEKKKADADGLRG